MKIAIKTFWPAYVWLILSTFLFCLPGTVLPKADWFDTIQLDKWIPVGLFSTMVLFWCLPFLHRPVKQRFTKLFTGIAISFFAYGILMELVQHFFILNRSFDWGDIAADAVGCLVGLFISRKQLK